ncbi:hypothetical protein YC2023_108190 [Brassica napus]
MRNQSFWVPGGEWSLRLNLTQHGETYQVQTKGRRSRNKVSVGEPAKGLLSYHGYAFIHAQDFSFGWIVRIASGYHQTPARKVSRKRQLNSLLSPTRRRCLFGSSAAM